MVSDAITMPVASPGPWAGRLYNMICGAHHRFVAEVFGMNSCCRDHVANIWRKSSIFWRVALEISHPVVVTTVTK